MTAWAGWVPLLERLANEQLVKDLDRLVQVTHNLAREDRP